MGRRWMTCVPRRSSCAARSSWRSSPMARTAAGPCAGPRSRVEPGEAASELGRGRVVARASSKPSARGRRGGPRRRRAVRGARPASRIVDAVRRRRARVPPRQPAVARRRRSAGVPRAARRESAAGRRRRARPSTGRGPASSVAGPSAARISQAARPVRIGAMPSADPRSGWTTTTTSRGSGRRGERPVPGPLTLRQRRVRARPAAPSASRSAASDWSRRGRRHARQVERGAVMAKDGKGGKRATPADDDAATDADTARARPDRRRPQGREAGGQGGAQGRQGRPEGRQAGGRRSAQGGQAGGEGRPQGREGRREGRRQVRSAGGQTRRRRGLAGRRRARRPSPSGSEPEACGRVAGVRLPRGGGRPDPTDARAGGVTDRRARRRQAAEDPSPSRPSPTPKPEPEPASVDAEAPADASRVAEARAEARAATCAGRRSRARSRSGARATA